jgi:hypothetical protein
MASLAGELIFHEPLGPFQKQTSMLGGVEAVERRASVHAPPINHEDTPATPLARHRRFAWPPGSALLQGDWRASSLFASAILPSHMSCHLAGAYRRQMFRRHYII